MMRSVVRALVVGAGLIAVACVDLGGPKDGVVSISTLRLPSPYVVLGDIMRDSLGTPAPLSLTAFGASGEVLTDEVITFLSLDTTASVDAGGTVRGLFRDTLGARIVASAGGLQAPAQRVIVTVAPTNVAKDPSTTPLVFDNTTPDSTSQNNWSAPLTLTVSGAASVPAQGFVVTFAVIRSPTPVTAGTPTVYVGDGAKNSPRDTTDTKGTATRRAVLRLAAVGDPALIVAGTKTDTIIVRATVKYLGANVPGSPVDFIVPVSRKP